MADPAFGSVSAQGPAQGPAQASAQGPAGGTVTIRYWAAARAAAGVEQDELAVSEGTTLADVLAGVSSLHSDRPRLAEVVAVCSVLVGERPVGTSDPAQVRLRAGDVVELLPPFAGG